MDHDIERLVLERDVEDFTGLWELVWEMYGQHRVEPEATAVVRAAVKNLLDRQWVSLFRGRSFAGDQVPLSDDEVDRALESNDSWQAPSPSQEHVRIAATPEGERAFLGHPRERDDPTRSL